MAVAPGRMIDSFLSIPDAESLPLYRMVLKLACVCGADSSAGERLAASRTGWLYVGSCCSIPRLRCGAGGWRQIQPWL